MTVFSVPDMSCGHCKTAIEGAIHKLDTAAAIDVDLDTRVVKVSTGASPDAIIDALKAEGYPATVTG